MLVSQNINKKILFISFFLVLIAISLSAAGLYSQVSLRIIDRSKEIAVRKIFGASNLQVIAILNYDFLVILTAACFAGAIAGYYLNMALMDSIWEYFTGFTAITYIIPVIFLFTVLIITVIGKVNQAATKNPAHSLRYE